MNGIGGIMGPAGLAGLGGGWAGGWGGLRATGVSPGVSGVGGVGAAAPSGISGWGGGGLGIPTAAGEEERGLVPSYFTEPPRGYAPLSPLAQAYLSQMFPQYLWGGGETTPYTTTPYRAAKRTAPSEEFPEGEILEPEVAEVKGLTAKVTPKAASAQLYQQLQAQGALPSLRQYVEDVLEIPWESYVSTMQAYWPAAQKGRATTWRTPRQL